MYWHWLRKIYKLNKPYFLINIVKASACKDFSIFQLASGTFALLRGTKYQRTASLNDGFIRDVIWKDKKWFYICAYIICIAIWVRCVQTSIYSQCVRSNSQTCCIIVGLLYDILNYSIIWKLINWLKTRFRSVLNY